MNSILTSLEALVPIYTGSAFIGLIIGSFLNTVIYRLPKMMSGQHPHHSYFSLLYPASHCPHCNSPLAITHLVPVLSYILLRGKCAFCGQKISPFYPTIEIASVALSVTVVWRMGLDWPVLPALLFAYMLLTLSAIDFQKKVLPDEITLSLLWLGLLVNINGWFSPLTDAVLGAVAGYSVFWVLHQLYLLTRKKQGLGHGDMKLLAALGAWFGWQAMPIIVAISAISGLLVALPLLATKKIRHQEPIPFGPFLCLAGLLFLLFPDSMHALPKHLALLFR